MRSHGVGSGLSIVPVLVSPVFGAPAAAAPADVLAPSASGLYLVRFAEPPLARYAGGAAGIAAAAPIFADGFESGNTGASSATVP
jgi:hypothetical protein